MLLFTFFISKIFTTNNLDKIISPNGESTFFGYIDDETEQFTVILRNINKREGLRYLITTPSETKKHILKKTKKNKELSDSYSKFYESSSEEDIGLPLDPMEGPVREVYKEKGMYTIQVTNTSNHDVSFNITSFTSKKVNDTNKGVVELRALLHRLRDGMDQLQSENHLLSSVSAQQAKEARRIKRMVNLLIIFPILTMAIGWFKHVFARQMVKPKGQKFKGLF